MSEDIHGRPDPIPPSPKRDDETLKILRYFFRQMCKEERTPPQLAVQYLPEYLLQWVESHLYLYSKAEVLEQAQADEVGWEFLQEILANATGALMINPLWPAITLAHRGDPTHPVKLIHGVLQITWEDGRLLPLSFAIPAEVMENGAINDAFLGVQLGAMFKHFMKQVVEVGLDRMHDNMADDFGGEYPFQVAIGLLQQTIPQVKPEIQQKCWNYMRLFQALVEPSMSPEAKQKMAALKAARLKKQQQGTVGGFDAGE